MFLSGLNFIPGESRPVILLPPSGLSWSPAGQTWHSILYIDLSIDNALQLSLYWESDLRILSYFLNKRKELEYNIWNPADLQYLATLVRGKVTKTIELQGISQYWKGNEGPFTSWRHFEQQGSWRFCCWELKMLVTLHGLLCSTWKFYQIFV